MTARELILEAVRSAPPAQAADLPGVGPPQEASGYRDALHADRVGCFTRRAEELGVAVHTVQEPGAVAAVVASLCRGKLTYVEPALEDLRLALQGLGVPVVGWDRLPDAEVGVTGADYGVAESGTLVVVAGPHRPRSGSLLPPVHVAVLREDRIVADLFELVGQLGPLATGVVLATGPSRSADIEMSLAVGVHGPGTVHVVLVPGGQEPAGGPAK